MILPSSSCSLSETVLWLLSVLRRFPGPLKNCFVRCLNFAQISSVLSSGRFVAILHVTTITRSFSHCILFKHILEHVTSHA